jgi:hypothetical protein
MITSVRVSDYVRQSHSVDLIALLGETSTGLLSIGPRRLPLGNFRQPLIRISAFQVVEEGGPLLQLISS